MNTTTNYQWWDCRFDDDLAAELGDDSIGWVEYCPNEGDAATSWMIVYGLRDLKAADAKGDQH